MSVWGVGGGRAALLATWEAQRTAFPAGNFGLQFRPAITAGSTRVDTPSPAAPRLASPRRPSPRRPSPRRPSPRRPSPRRRSSSRSSSSIRTTAPARPARGTRPRPSARPAPPPRRRRRRWRRAGGAGGSGRCRSRWCDAGRRAADRVGPWRPRWITQLLDPARPGPARPGPAQLYEIKTRPPTRNMVQRLLYKQRDHRFLIPRPR